MKRILGLLILAAVLSVSCEKQDTQSPYMGKAVRFTTSVGTKTSYSGTVANQKEAIFWTDGDVFTVSCEEANFADASKTTADYRVTASAGVATAVDPKTSGDEILWGEGTHHFFAAYPSGHLNGNVLSANISSSQRVTETSDRVFAPSLSDYGYMVASATAEPESTVSLVFKPIFSTLEFTVSPGPYADVVVSGFRLTSDPGAIAGSFQATISDSAPVITTSSPSSMIMLNFGGNVTVNRDQTLTFSVIALPSELKNLKAIFTVDGQSIELPLKNGDDYITFAAGKKSRINALGILGPEATAAGITTVINDQDVDDYTITVNQ